MLKTKGSLLALVVGLAVAGTLGHREAHAQIPDRFVLVVIDRSGSMLEPAVGGAPGETRYTRARARAEEKINLFAAFSGRTFVSLWSFEGNSYIRHTGFVSPQAAIAAIASVPGPGGSTPLAMTVCDAVDALVAATTFKTSRILQLNSDGLENATPPSHACAGPPSVSAVIPYDVGSWENKVLAKAQGVVVHVDLFKNSIRFAGAARSKGAELDKGPGDVRTQAVDLEDFFSSLAATTGGTYTAVIDTQPVPVTGDVTGDFCVNDDDLNAVFDNVGLTVPPAPAAHDLNADGIVDIVDYLQLFNFYGSGPGC